VKILRTVSGMEQALNKHFLSPSLVCGMVAPAVQKEFPTKALAKCGGAMAKAARCSKHFQVLHFPNANTLKGSSALSSTTFVTYPKSYV
jgi:hypothetical protein